MSSWFISCTCPSPSSDEATYQQIPHHLALTVTAQCNAVLTIGLGWWRRPGGEDKSGGT